MSVGAIVTGLGRAIVSRGFGGGAADTAGGPGTITLPRCATLCTITLPDISMANRINYGDIVVISPILTYNSTGALADPDSFTARIKTPLGQRFDLVYQTAPSEEGGDAVIRNSVGSYAVHIEMNASRGLGTFGYSIITTGNSAAEGAQFLAQELPA